WVFGIVAIGLFALCVLAFALLLLISIFPNTGALAMVDAIALLVLTKKLSLIIPIFLISFWAWLGVTRFRTRIRVLLFAITLGPIAVLEFYGHNSICLNSEYFLDASVDLNPSNVYFVTEREVLINDHPPFPPSPMKCDLVLEKVHLDGT